MRGGRKSMRVEELSEREIALIMQARVETDTPYKLAAVPAADGDEGAVFDSALELLALVQGDRKASLSDLATALDHVASAFADAPRGSFVADCVPRPDIKVDRELISRRFPELGLYATSDPLDLEGKPLVADAVDDLLDITLQMQAFIALSDAPEEALRQLHALGGHWMAHLRGLSRYLHALRYGW